MCASPLLSIGINLNSYELKKNKRMAQNNGDEIDDPFEKHQSKDPKRDQKKSPPDAVEHPKGGGIQNNPGDQNTG